MKLEVTEHGLRIFPETPQDKAYLEYVLGTHQPGDDIVGTLLAMQYRPFEWGYILLRAVEYPVERGE